jgi:hypothetical protein
MPAQITSIASLSSPKESIYAVVIKQLGKPELPTILAIDLGKFNSVFSR